ncbi:MAG: transposase family protein, partial [Planctomycetes bacterium]|nr:transposase family protein [Planctomycetota bacterium]
MRRQTIEHVRDTLGRDLVTERGACRVLGQARNTQRRKACVADDEPQLVERIVWIATEYGRYDDRRITALLRAEGWWMNHTRPTHRNHVWSHDFVMDPTADGRAFRMLTIVDEYTREYLAIDVSRKLTSEDVLERLSDLFARKGVPDHIRSDNGSAEVRWLQWCSRNQCHSRSTGLSSGEYGGRNS